jgi:hypothetical protein
MGFPSQDLDISVVDCFHYSAGKSLGPPGDEFSIFWDEWVWRAVIFGHLVPNFTTVATVTTVKSLMQTCISCIKIMSVTVNTD